MKIKVIQDQLGSSLVEVLVAIGLMGIMLPALAAALITSSTSRPNAEQQLEATNTLRQVSAITRSLSENSWASVQTNGTYHPSLSGSNWTLNSGSGTLNGFTDQIDISSINRDSGGNIVSSGGTLDPSTKLVNISISWTTPHSASISSAMYLTRWSNEASWVQQSSSDFGGDSITNLTISTVGSTTQIGLNSGATSGQLTSSTFDAGSDVGFNMINFTDNSPTGTEIKFQIATNDDNSTWNYVGPDGTSATYYDSPGAIPLNAVSGRYIRYQASFSTTNSSLPSLNKVNITYSP